MTSVMWFRRDLRVSDNPALIEACADGPTLPLFVLDPVLWDAAGPSRRGYLAASLQALRHDVPISVLSGDPVRQVVLAAQEVGAERVHVAADFGPYGRQRDTDVEQALADVDIELVRTGSPYAVAPGRVTKGDDTAYRVFTPFSKAWLDHGWRDPIDPPADPSWRHLKGSVAMPDVELPPGLRLPAAGEGAAVERWAEFLDRVADYDDDRDRPDINGTSHMSPHLKWGEIHPRTMLADLARLRSSGAATYRKELAWREFYADVLAERPETARDYLRADFATMQYDEPGDQLTAWQEGQTGYPIVDAGMRQLRATGWMHNRLRMVVASFLVKDLHLEWQHGARHFMHWLVDGDLASNQHGWQWTAGCGTDASPFFRVFNPTGQGRKFDARGEYVRRWVPELADADVVIDPHDPDADVRDLVGYPPPIVDHAEERRVALDRWEQIR